MNCCTYECNQGRNCPVRTAKITANAAQPEDRSSWDVISGVMLNGLFAVALVAVVICLSGWAGFYFQR